MESWLVDKELAGRYAEALERMGNEELWRLSGESLTSIGRAKFAESMVVSGRSAREVAVALVKQVSVEQEPSSDEQNKQVAAVSEWLRREDAASGLETPTYNFARRVFWAADSKRGKDRTATVTGRKVKLDEGVTVFQADAATVRDWFEAGDHIVYGAEVVPGAAHIAVVVEQSCELGVAGSGDESKLVLRNVEMRQVVVVDDEMVLQYVHRDGRFEVRSLREGVWKMHVLGETGRASESEAAAALTSIAEEGGMAERASGDEQSIGELLDQRAGVKVGPSFHWLKRWQKSERATVGWLEAPSEWSGSRLRVPVEILDSMIQTGVIVVAAGKLANQFYLPFSVEEVVVRTGARWNARSDAMVTETRVAEEREETIGLNVVLEVERRGVVAMRGLMLARVEEETFASQALAETSVSRGLMYEVVWEHEEAGERATRGWQTGKTVVVVGGEQGVVDEVAARLEASGLGWAAVERCMVQSGDEAWSSSMSQGEGEGGKMMTMMMARCDVVVNVVGCGAKAGQEELKMYAGVMREVARIRGRQVTVFSVVNGGQSGRATRPWARAMWSMGRTVAAESGEWVTHVLVETGPAMGAGQAVEQEVQRAAAAERGGEVAYDERGGRSVASVRRRRDGKSEGERREARTAFEGLVVMTGGFGGIGKVYAEQLASREGGRGGGGERGGGGGGGALAVLGRSGASESDRQASFVASSSHNVVCGRCDVSEGEDARAVTAVSRASTGKLVTGVLHLAGKVSDGMLGEMEWRAFAEVVRPKVAGLQSMWRAVGERGAAWLSFSSVTSMLGNVGQANYGAANGFLDGLAAREAGRGVASVSINWGAWDVGMYARRAGGKSTGGGGASSEGAIGAGEAEALLEAAWKSGASEVGVMRMDWSRVASYLSRRLGSEKDSKRRRAVGGSGRELSEAEVVQIIDTSVKSVLGMSEGERVDESVALRDLGFDSITSVDLRDRISEQLGTQLSATILFDYPTLKALRGRIVELVGVNGSPGQEDSSSASNCSSINSSKRGCWRIGGWTRQGGGERSSVSVRRRVDAGGTVEGAGCGSRRRERGSAQSVEVGGHVRCRCRSGGQVGEQVGRVFRGTGAV